MGEYVHTVYTEGVPDSVGPSTVPSATVISDSSDLLSTLRVLLCGCTAYLELRTNKIPVGLVPTALKRQAFPSFEIRIW